MKISHIRILNQQEPLGIDGKPYLSWMLESEQQDTVQTAYAYTVETEDGTRLYESGRIESDETAYINLLDEMPDSRTRLKVRLSVWDNHGHTDAAETAFEMGLLKTSDWKASWAVPKAKRKKSKPGFGNQDPATLFRKEFFLKEKPSRARVYATCHGIYELSVNGKRPDQRYFAPEHTVYRDYLCYQTYNVTDLLRKGKNVLGMYVGDGWYLGPGTIPDMKKLVHAHAVLFQLEVTYPNGDQEIIGSDASVKTAFGPIRSADLYAGECYDAREEKPGWDTPEAEISDAVWTDAKAMPFSYENLKAQNGEGVFEVRRLPVKEVLQSPKGETILDFGQVIAGVAQMHVHADAGTSITMDHCEVLDREGNYFNNILSAGGVGQGCDQRDVYISDGKEAVYTPRFTFHGFRYVRISGLKTVRADDFHAIVLSTKMENLGTFETSDSRLNRLYENTRWSQTSNMISIPTDCPQREKAGWTGDMLVYAKTAMQNADCTALLTRWLDNMSYDQDASGVIPMVVPNNGSYPKTEKIMSLSSGEKGPAASAGWGDAAVIVPWRMYEVTGNRQILEQQFDCMKKWCDYIIRKAASKKPKHTAVPDEIERYLWDTGFHYGEWMIPSQNKDGLDMKKIQSIMKQSTCYTAPIFGWYSVSTFARVCEVLGRMKLSQTYKETAEKMKQAIQQGVMRPDGTMPVELMGAYVLPIAFDLVPDAYKDSFAQHLVHLIEENDGCMDTGFLATPFLMDALCKIDRIDLAYSILWQEKAPSWLSEVKAGATSIWESCFGYDQSGQPCNLSFNHYSFGCIDDWMFRYIGGISTDTPGYKHLIFAPKPDGRLTHAKRSFLTPQGLAVCEWKNEESFSMEVTIPANCTAAILLPDGTREERGSGHYVFEASI